MQTRGGLLGIFLFSLFYLIFIKEKLFNKLKKIILIIIIPILFYEVVMSSFTKTVIKTNTPDSSSRYYNKKNGLLLHNSGRVDLWKIAIKEIKKNNVILALDLKAIGKFLRKSMLILIWKFYMLYVGAKIYPMVSYTHI